MAEDLLDGDQLFDQGDEAHRLAAFGALEGTVEVLVFSTDGDPLATVIVSKSEAVRLVSLPVMMHHAFRAAWEKSGRVFVEPVEWED